VTNTIMGTADAHTMKCIVEVGKVEWTDDLTDDEIERMQQLSTYMQPRYPIEEPAPFLLVCALPQIALPS
jgi:hypothetical protein